MQGKAVVPTHNPRKELAPVARQWLKDLLPGLGVYHTSGTLYCFREFTDITKFMNGYNYDDSDAMIDYFDTNFYMNLAIGKWDKPFIKS